MARSGKQVKADKVVRDQETGRDVEASRAEAREATQAYVLGFRLAQLREEAGVSQTELARRMIVRTTVGLLNTCNGRVMREGPA